TYFNPILKFGLERYAAAARRAGVDGHIVTDLTPEEADEWRRISAARNLDTIFLVAPTTTPERIHKIASMSTGFLYCVSRTGVTGARTDVPADLRQVVSNVRAEASLPVLVGFGVSEAAHVRKIDEFADGVVVGSALVDLIHRYACLPDLTDRVRSFAANLKEATVSERNGLAR
ncbi:MAG TPA: tryptophan synthase subunit alpha, partial [Chthonomonadales bacterium]|nr:tryptophan synthase subunit alpha [Chthonomonadales bacterium]